LNYDLDMKLTSFLSSEITIPTGR